jgi:pyridoxal phosphate enzyme (YggS family)
MSLAERYAEVRERIARAARRSGRAASDITLVAVTKNAEPDQIRELITLGQVDLGENKAQQLQQRAAIIDEWLGRHKTMPNTPWPPRKMPESETWRDETPVDAGRPSGLVRWHMIGHLQRNKARKAVELCRLIHSLDSLRLAEELQLIGLKRDKPIEVLMQVNVSGEQQKYGVSPPAVVHLAESIGTMIHVKLRGMMCMAAATDDEAEIRGAFGRCRELFEEVRTSGMVDARFNILSMGMSGDYEIAVEEGANMVRVGSALFGEAKASEEDERDLEE